MRSLKTSGGLTHGSGMTELQRNVWTQAMPICAEVHNSMQNLSGVLRRTGEQDTDLGASRLSRDWKDNHNDEILSGTKSFSVRGIM